MPAPRGRCLLRAAGLQRASHSSLCGVSARYVGGEGEPGATHKLSLFQFPSFPPLPLVTFPRGPLQRRRRRKNVEQVLKAHPHLAAWFLHVSQAWASSWLRVSA